MVSITCDGLNANHTVFKQLGAKMNHENPKPWFTHPCEPTWKINTFLDAVHMLKLARNCLANEGKLIHNGLPIDWNYITELHKLKESEHFRFVNKLSKAHIEWRRKRLKSVLPPKH